MTVNFPTFPIMAFLSGLTSYEGEASTHLPIDAEPKARNNFDHSVSHFSSTYCVVQLKFCHMFFCVVVIEIDRKPISSL